MVGVPALGLWLAGPSVRTTWPIWKARSRRMNHGPASRLMRKAVMLAAQGARAGDASLVVAGDFVTADARALVEKVAGAEATVVQVLPGTSLVGLRYEPLYESTTWAGVDPLRFVDGRTQRPASLADLPPPSTRRWVIRRKAEVVAAVRGGLLSLDDACKRYTLTVEEFLAWQHAIDRFGLAMMGTDLSVDLNLGFGDDPQGGANANTIDWTATALTVRPGSGAPITRWGAWQRIDTHSTYWDCAACAGAVSDSAAAMLATRQHIEAGWHELRDAVAATA